MSNPKTTMSRDIDEVEGTLLPVATQVVECCNNTNNNTSMAEAEAAVPVTETFNYDVTIAEEERLKEQEQEEHVIEAITIPDNGTQHNYAGVSDDSRNAVGNAERVGRFKSEEELDAIRIAKQRIFPQNYHEENSIKKANETAMRRDREGLQVIDDHLDSRVSSSSKTNEIMRNQQQEQKPRASGYQVKEYDVVSYDTKGYDVTEYKSVYD
mmetsp:Transcript_18037/g.20845  ORF Transcript_18037/g.20845 Transcript_18037/m.20845 type:complete len:211 (+) Transcript_18037:90-722(+)